MSHMTLTGAHMPEDCQSEIKGNTETQDDTGQFIDLLLQDIKQEPQSEKMCDMDDESSEESLISSDSVGSIRTESHDHTNYQFEESFNSAASLPEHEQHEQLDEKRHRCTECEKSFSVRSYLNKHIRKVHGEKKFKCNLCDYSTTSNHHLVRHSKSLHVKVITSESLDDCESPTKTYVSIPSANEGVKLNVNEGEKLNGCLPVDSNNVSNTNHAQRNYRSGNGSEKRFSCDQCGSKYSHKDKLKLHMRIVHEGVKAFVCGDCGKNFSQKSHLRQHVMSVHSEERPFKCTECSKSFSQKGNLDRHVDAVHAGLKPHTCTECGKSFSRTSYLERHVNDVHTKEKTYTCSRCDRTFSRRDTLTTHMKIHK